VFYQLTEILKSAFLSQPVVGPGIVLNLLFSAAILTERPVPRVDAISTEFDSAGIAVFSGGLLTCRYFHAKE
jgi:hypothetical protein